MTTSTEFPTNELLTTYRYRRTLRAYPTSNWPQLFARWHKGVKVLSTGSFGAIVLRTYRWSHQIRQEMPQNAKKIKSGTLMDSYVASVVRGTHWRPTLGTFALCQGRLNGWWCENCSTFFSLVPKGKEKNIFSKCLFLTFWKQISECIFFPRYCVKNNYIFRKCMKNEYHSPDFSSFCDVIFREQIWLKSWQNFFKNHVFPVLYPHKINPVALDL